MGPRFSVLLTGAISFWNADQRRLNEDSKVHRCCLIHLSWSPDGKLLATVDEKGKVCHNINRRNATPYRCFCDCQASGMTSKATECHKSSENKSSTSYMA